MAEGPVWSSAARSTLQVAVKFLMACLQEIIPSGSSSDYAMAKDPWADGSDRTYWHFSSFEFANITIAFSQSIETAYIALRYPQQQEAHVSGVGVRRRMPDANIGPKAWG